MDRGNPSWPRLGEKKRATDRRSTKCRTEASGSGKGTPPLGFKANKAANHPEPLVAPEPELGTSGVARVPSTLPQDHPRANPGLGPARASACPASSLETPRVHPCSQLLDPLRTGWLWGSLPRAGREGSGLKGGAQRRWRLAHTAGPHFNPSARLHALALSRSETCKPSRELGGERGATKGIFWLCYHELGKLSVSTVGNLPWWLGEAGPAGRRESTRIPALPSWPFLKMIKKKKTKTSR